MDPKLEVKQQTSLFSQAPPEALRRGLVARISGFHPEGPGSIPGVGTSFLPFFHLTSRQAKDASLLPSPKGKQQQVQRFNFSI